MGEGEKERRERGGRRQTLGDISAGSQVNSWASQVREPMNSFSLAEDSLSCVSFTCNQENLASAEPGSEQMNKRLVE